jgi:outer membrane protein assembly factor BamE
MPLRHIAIAAVVLLVAACGWMPTLPVLSPYKMDIQQGNIVTQEMVAKLQPGMSRSQVRFVLGTPLVADMFHADRWDYVYRLEQGGRMVEERKLVAVFSGDKLLRIEGDVVPAAAKPAATGPAPAAAEKPAAKPEPAATDQPAAKP